MTTASDLNTDKAKSLLTAVLAGIDACPGDSQVPILRSFLERGLDKLEEIEDGFYDYLAECALLAGQNLQDIRLQDLEGRVDKIENPEGPTIAEMVTEFAIVLAIELAVVGLVHVGIGAILFWAGQRVATKAARTSQRQIQREIKANLSGITTAQNRLAELTREQQTIRTRYQLSALLPAFYQPADIDDRFRLAMRNNSIANREITEQLETIRRALAANESAARDAGAAFERALNSPDVAGLSKKWEKFLNNAFVSTALQRTHENLGGAFAAYAQSLNASNPPESSPAFLSSLITGMQLTDIRGKRTIARGEYASLRRYIQSLPDDDLDKDESVQDLAGAIALAIPELESMQSISDMIRPGIIAGCELALWYQWLATRGVLTIPSRQEVSLEYKLKNVPGGIIRGILIDEERPPTHVQISDSSGASIEKTIYNYRGVFYPGILMLGEFQTEYLFKKYASPYFDKGFSTLPFDFEAVRYANVIDRPAHFYGGFLTNTDRAQRLNEMRLMVVLFFTQFFESVKDKKSLGMTVDQVFSGRDWMKMIPQGQRRWDESMTDSIPSLEGASDAFKAMYADLGLEQSRNVDDALNRLRNLLTDLELNILMYELVYVASTSESADSLLGMTADEALREIEAQQNLLRNDYPDLQEMAKDRPDLLQAIRAEFDERVVNLGAWMPHGDGRGWKWYGPVQEN